MRFISLLCLFLSLACTTAKKQPTVVCLDAQGQAILYTPQAQDLEIDRGAYQDQLYGFWLAQCIANWTGLITEMDKIGNIGEIQTGAFYTREDWGTADLPNIWSGDAPSKVSDTIDFVFRDQGEPWGADDDTDIEYMYQYLLDTHETSLLSPAQIREGWLRHIKAEEENYLWVSNQQAFDLMQKGMLPPATSDSAHNPHYDMIDAQLTTEIFGLFAPGRPDMALKMAELPIRTTADQSAAEIARFYVHMHALASSVAVDAPVKERLQAIALQARSSLSPEGYPIKMYDYVWQAYQEGWTWEATRDSVYEKYQVRQEDGYDITSQQLPCNGCFAAGINFAASLVSLFFGEGDLKETIKIGALAGWDSDNPTATWGGLIGFMLGKKGVEAAFGRTFSDTFFIHRTRQHFPNEGLDTFGNMAQTGIRIIDRVVREELKGAVTEDGKKWYVPQG